MNAQDLEQRARELLAAEYERDGKAGAADHIRTQPLLPNKARAVRAIAAALRQQPAPVDLEQFRDACYFMKAHGSLQRCTEADRLLSIIDNAGKVDVAEPVAWQRRYAHQLPAGGMCAWHEITRDEYEAAVRAEYQDRTYEYRALYTEPHQPAPVVDDARMARALEWFRHQHPVGEHVHSIEEAIAAYSPNRGARTVRVVDDAEIERAAKVLADYELPGKTPSATWARIDANLREKYRGRARAALTAIARAQGVQP